MGGGFHPGDIDEGPLPDLPQHSAGATLPPEEQVVLLENRALRSAEAEGDKSGGVY